MDKMKNLVVGLTGQTGAGKTTVSDYLKENGVTIIDADHIAREVVESGSACIADIALEFGCEYINMDGTLNRKKMAKTVFTDKAKLKKAQCPDLSVYYRQHPYPHRPAAPRAAGNHRAGCPHFV